MTIEKEDKPNYIKEELKPEWRETKGFKYQIFRDHVRFLFEDKELRIINPSLKQIMNNVDQANEAGYYVGQCIDCHKFDAIVQGRCKPCSDIYEQEQL